jgi:hypothetical protein
MREKCIVYLQRRYRLAVKCKDVLRYLSTIYRPAGIRSLLVLRPLKLLVLWAAGRAGRGRTRQDEAKVGGGGRKRVRK